eukprot:5280122-Heterocapsa_arctica.AAC.1
MSFAKKLCGKRLRILRMKSSGEMSRGSSASQSHDVPLTLRWSHSSLRQTMAWPRSGPVALTVRPNMM